MLPDSMNATYSAYRKPYLVENMEREELGYHFGRKRLTLTEQPQILKPYSPLFLALLNSSSRKQFLRKSLIA